MAGGLKRLLVREKRSFDRSAGRERLFGPIAKETSDTTRPPVGRVIKLGVGTGTHGAEEGVFFGIDDDADMAAPNNQVASLGRVHAREIRIADVEFARTDVVVGKAGLCVNVVNQVRTVRFGFGLGVYRGNGSQNLATLCSGDRTRSGRFRRSWPDILAERPRGRREAQHYEDESTRHFVSLADRGENRTGHAAKTTPSEGTGPLFCVGLEDKKRARSFKAGTKNAASVT